MHVSPCRAVSHVRTAGLDDDLCSSNVCGVVWCVQDGRINYTEFAAMMRKGDPEPSNPKKRRDIVL
jgi:calcium-dependent protein kinase